MSMKYPGYSPTMETVGLRAIVEMNTRFLTPWSIRVYTLLEARCYPIRGIHGPVGRRWALSGEWQPSRSGLQLGIVSPSYPVASQDSLQNYMYGVFGTRARRQCSVHLELRSRKGSYQALQGRPAGSDSFWIDTEIPLFLHTIDTSLQGLVDLSTFHCIQP